MALWSKIWLIDILYFILWVVLSVVGHSAAAFVVRSAEGGSKQILVLLLVLSQCIFSAVFSIAFRRSNLTLNGSNVVTASASVCNGIAIYTTLLSFTLNSPSTTLALKTTEPLMAILVRAILCSSHLTLVELSGLPLTVLTVVIYMAIERPQNVYVCMLPLLSNVAFACRNTMLKHTSVENKQLLFFYVNFWSTIAAAAGVQYLWGPGVMKLITTSSTQWLLFLSGIATGAYAYISTQVILNRFSVVLHSSMNSVKRILVTFLVFLFWSFSSGTVRLHHIALAVVPVAISLALVHRSNGKKEQHLTAVKDELNHRNCIIIAALLLLSTLCLTSISYARATTNATTNEHIILSSSLRIGRHQITGQHLINDYQFDLYTNISKVIGGKKFAILMNTQCSHSGNLGDYALNYGTVILLDYFKVKILASCCAADCDYLLRRTQSILASTGNVTDQNLVFIYVGGGNFGDLYYTTTVMNFVNFIRKFPSYEYVVFPQSPYYGNKANAQLHTKLLHSYASQITFLARDQQSYVRIMDEYKFTFKTILTIDTAFAFGLQKVHYLPFVDILLFLRSDSESKRYTFDVNDHKEHTFLREDWMHPTNKTIDGVDMQAVLATYDEIVAEPFWFVSRGCVMITDRLHGHIIASLSQKPHVLLDNSYGKVGAFYETWTSTLPYARHARNIEDAYEKAVALLAEYPCDVRSPSDTKLVL